MPYKFIKEKKKIPRKYDKRIKLRDEDRKQIKEMFFTQHLYIREIARRFSDKCCRRSIQYILFPNRLEIVKEQFKERQADGRYYDKEKHRKYMKKYRHHKKRLADKNLLI